MTDVWVSLPRYTILLIVESIGGVLMIIEAPPIARWTIGKTSYEVLKYYTAQKDACVTWV